MNLVVLMGRLTKDPETRTNSGTTVSRYTLAVDRRYKTNNGQTADFINCIAFGRQAEFAEQYLHKGTKMVITGRIQTGSYTNKDGQRVYTTEVVVDSAEFAESKSANSTNNADGISTPTDTVPVYSTPAPEAPETDVPEWMKMSEDVDDLPFS